MKHLRGLIRPIVSIKTMVAAMTVVSVAVLPGCNNKVEFSGKSADQKKPQVVLDQVFPTSRIDDGDVTYRPAFGEVDESLVLREKSPSAFSLRQIERAVSVETFRQGHDGSQASEEFQVSKIGKLDLLIVIDDSKSMDEEQANLATKLGALTKHLKTTDWRIGVITSTSCALRNGGKPIMAGDPTAEADFIAAINVGTAGDGYERGILRAYQHLTGAAACAGQNSWLREDAAFAMLFVSDEDSYCVVGDCPNGSTATYMTDYLKNTRKVDVNKTKSYALVWDDQDPNCKAPNDEAVGTRYIALANNFNGFTSSICETDYTTTLERISQNVSRIVTRDFDLKFVPSNSLQLTIDGVPFNDYVIAGKKITLNDVAETALKLKITYRYDPVPKFDTFVIAGAPDLATMQVFINGAPLSASKYDYRPDVKELFFSDMPPDNAEVKVKFRKDDPLQREFDFTPTKISGEVVRVEVAGKETTAFNYNPDIGILTLDDAPADGAVVTVYAKPADAAILRYKAGAGVVIPNVQSVAAVDATTGDPVSVVVDGAELIFEEADVVDGRDVVVTYDYGNRDMVLQHELAQEPLAGSVNVSVVSGDENCVNSVEVSGKTVRFLCDGDKLEEVRVSYKYVAEIFTEFAINHPVDSDTLISVYVDGARLQDFTVVDGKVVIPSTLLQFDSSVRIIVTQAM